MTGNATCHTEDRLALRSRLSDMAQVPPWVAILAARYAIPEKVQFAMNLCLEEAVSNVIRHGYAGEEDRSILVCFAAPPGGNFEFIIDDEAPHFNPLEPPELPPVDPVNETRVGGQGIRLLRRFAGAIKYQPLPTGNRLHITFPIAGSTVQTK
jgi:anti-sigma regulatory factor (Ser/Thr protein kinase)